MLRIIILILLCYILGSFSPSHLLGKLRGVDLRRRGTRNLGASNALFTLGKTAALLTLLIDAGKGAAAVALGVAFNLSPGAVYACALAAILGHIFPFYLRFRGGKGVATCIGAALALTLSSVASRASAIVSGASAGFPAAQQGIQELPYHGTAVLLLVSYAIFMVCYSTIRYKKPDVKPVRKLVRLAGLLFPLAHYWWGREAGLWMAGTALAIVLAIDAIRLTNENVNSAVLKKLAFFAKKKEAHTISTTTALLISLAASIALFDSTIVLVTSAMFIVSDAAAEIFGKSYGKHRLGSREGWSSWFGTKTAEGSAGGLASSLLLGIGLYGVLPVSIPFLLAAALLVTVIEAVSGKADDNLITILTSSFILQIMANGQAFIP